MPPNTSRRRRYERRPHTGTFALTPVRLALLRCVAGLRIASTPQIAALVGPSEKSARRHLRELFDQGLVDVVPVGRAALAEPGSQPDPSLLYGSAPKIYVLSVTGADLIEEVDGARPVRVARRYGPQNSLFLAHELAIRDVRVWLECAARCTDGHRVARWVDGKEAEIPIAVAEKPHCVTACFRPDAWFIYQFRGRVLPGLLELDRGTERGAQRWKEKLLAYAALFGGGELVRTIGYTYALVVVVTPDPRRSRTLSALVATHAPAIQHWFRITTRTMLQDRDVHAPLWQCPGRDELMPLIPRDLAG